MGNKLCDNIIFEIMKDPENISAQAMAHINECAECKKELEKFRQMNEMILKASPIVPSLKDSVLEKIKNEGMSPTPASVPTRKHFPIGTLSAVAAVLVVGILVYKGDILDKVNNVAKNDSDYIVYDANVENAAQKAEGYIADSAMYFNTYSDEEAVVETEACEAESVEEETIVVEAEEALQDTAMDSASYDKVMLSARPTTENAPSETGEMMFAPPAGNDEDSNDDSREEKRSSGGTGATAGTSDISKNDYVKVMLGVITENSDPEEVYKSIRDYYPDRISPEVFEKADGKKYIEFVMSINDFETDYTEENFLNFCGITEKF